MSLRDVVRPIDRSRYECDSQWDYLEDHLERFARDYGLNLDPDFQRGHVWTPEQRSRFIESCLRGVATSATRVILFNCPHWDNDRYKGDLPREMQIMDGLQRLTTVRMFMRGEVSVFGSLRVDDFRKTEFDPKRMLCMLRFAVFTLQTRAELLRHYLAINEGATPHSESELVRVRKLLEAA